MVQIPLLRSAVLRSRSKVEVAPPENGSVESSSSPRRAYPKRGWPSLPHLRRLRVRTAIVALAFVFIMLLGSFPTLAPGQSTTHGNTAGVAAVAAPPAPVKLGRPSSSGVARAPIPDQGAEFRALCAAGLVPSCPKPVASSQRPVPAGGADPASSWTNITPTAGKPNPEARSYPSMVYYPWGHEDILFGGITPIGSLFAQDTWAFAQNNWTEIISNTSCTSTTCPSPRIDAMMAYYPPMHAILLFGGVIGLLGFNTAYNDTWLFYNNQWHNISATAGPAPSPRFGGAMAWDALDNQIVLFGGSAADGQSVQLSGGEGDTWAFNGTWSNISAYVLVRSNYESPSARDSMAFTNSPSGYLLMFGGEHNETTIEDTFSPCNLHITGWWFYEDQWKPMLYGGTCVFSPAAGPVLPPGLPPPCGRVDAALGWSPKNGHFVLYGGYGPLVETGTYCGGTEGQLNDTYTYLNPPGNGFDWQSVGDSGDPSNRTGMGYASDFSANYFLIFGGGDATQSFNSTYRYYAIVHAKLTGPSTIDTNTSHLSFSIPFVVRGYGGSGTLDYTFSYAKLRSTNALVDSGTTDCSNLTNTGFTYGPLPYDGTWTIPCQPTNQSYNVFRLTLYVWDANNSTLSGAGFPVGGDYATANWTFTVLPPETARIYSEFKGVFYSGFSFSNTFSAFLKVGGTAADSVNATLGGVPVNFTRRSGGNGDWWDATVDMGSVTPGSALRVTGYWNGWTQNATYQVKIVSTPSWLASLFEYTDAVQTVTTSGAGPYNKSYSITESYSWSVADGSSSFALPSPMVGGQYSLIPAIQVTFGASSSGNVSLAGTLSVTPPSINLGVVSFKLTVSVGLTGKFEVLNRTQGISDVQWVQAKATITIAGDLGGNIPLYGFDVLGIDVGFTLVIDIKPSIALTMLLAPTTDTTKEIINGIQVMMTQLVGALTVALSVAVKFSIGIASVAIGGTLSIAVAFNITPTFHVGAGWLNGTVFAQATFICWNVNWNILGPAVIYSWTDPPPAGPRSLTTCPTCYNNGENATWSIESRYYVTASYDSNVWSANVTVGPAIEDIYPHTSVTGAPGYNGGYLFYSDDNASAPAQLGLGVSGLYLDPSTNRLTSVRSPSDPGFETDVPEAAASTNGSIYVVWAALPKGEASDASPAELTSLALHGARFYPKNQTWGPVQVFSSWGIVQSYRLDDLASGGVLTALIASTYLVGDSTPERLVEFNVTTGQQINNVSVAGLSLITSVRGTSGEAVIEDVAGNYSVVKLSTGVSVPLSPSVPPRSHLISASFVDGSSSTLALIYRNPNATDTVLYNVETDSIVANLSTDQSATETQAVFGNGTYYLFESVHTGVVGWTDVGGTFSNLTSVAVANLENFGLVQAGSSILLYMLGTNGNDSSPTVTLYLAEVGSTLAAVPGPAAPPPPPPTPTPTPKSSSSGSGSSTNYVLYLTLVAVADVALLAVLAIVRRRRGREPTTGPRDRPSSSAPESPPSPPTDESP